MRSDAPTPKTASAKPLTSPAPVAGNPSAMPLTTPPIGSWGVQIVALMPSTRSSRESRKLSRRPTTRRQSPMQIGKAVRAPSDRWAWTTGGRSAPANTNRYANVP
jgi:hypothetical protein